MALGLLALVLGLIDPSLALSSTTLQRPEAAARRHPGVAEHADFDVLRGEFDGDKVVRFFQTRPLDVAARLATVASTLRDARDMWDAQDALEPAARDRGPKLVSAVSSLGPVAVKVRPPAHDAETRRAAANATCSAAAVVTRGGGVVVWVWRLALTLTLSHARRGAPPSQVGQTLSQRPDICGAEACIALRGLQVMPVAVASRVVAVGSGR